MKKVSDLIGPLHSRSDYQGGNLDILLAEVSRLWKRITIGLKNGWNSTSQGKTVNIGPICPLGYFVGIQPARVALSQVTDYRNAEYLAKSARRPYTYKGAIWAMKPLIFR